MRVLLVLYAACRNDDDGCRECAQGENWLNEKNQKKKGERIEAGEHVGTENEINPGMCGHGI